VKVTTEPVTDAPAKALPDPSTFDVAAALDGMLADLTTYVRFTDPAQAYAIVLWAAHTYTIGCHSRSPRLLVTAAEKGSGKTTVLEWLEVHCLHAKVMANVSNAYLFRKVEYVARRLTILLDEIDTVFRSGKDNSELHGLINDGWRKGGTVGRVVMIEGVGIPTDFACHAPLAMAGNNTAKVPDTVLDRSIHIEMVRAPRDVKLLPYDMDDHHEPKAALRASWEAWADAHATALHEHEPDEVPEALGHRAKQNWRPLFAIADVAGGEWPARARQAAVTLTQTSDESRVSNGMRLLADIRDVYAEKDLAVVKSMELVAALNEMEESPWGSMGRGQGITAAWLASELKRYGIKPLPIKVNGKTIRGYKRAAFEPAWELYL
jgi:hypothetical protein